MTRTLAAFEEDSMRRKYPLGNAIFVVDMAGLGWKDCSVNVAKAYAKLVSCRDMLMPNTLKRIFLVRAPGVFAASWNMVKRFLDPATASKVEIICGDAASLALLRRHLPNEIIPGYMGGGLCVGGDPQCSAMLGSPVAEVPPDAISRLLAVIAGVDGPRREEGHHDVDMRSRKPSCSSCCFSFKC
eukprot:TRINITY_DN9059_c0_g1_i3.p1 TRINITY_DN9059_c0_g1~~TRINITY_DN9059_c0_g1_i3.p1  ORF type:complete len:185 (+),score=17.71 TRINITY_DN9059_c0_g1_i3:323-877(+)